MQMGMLIICLANPSRSFPMSDLHLPSAATQSTLSSRASSVVRVRSDDLLRGTREIVIEHRGEEYRLLRTRNDRLILNK